MALLWAKKIFLTGLEVGGALELVTWEGKQAGAPQTSWVFSRECTRPSIWGYFSTAVVGTLSHAGEC